MKNNIHLALKMYASVTDNVIDSAFGNFIALFDIQQGEEKYISHEELNQTVQQ